MVTLISHFWHPYVRGTQCRPPPNFGHSSEFISISKYSPFKISPLTSNGLAIFLSIFLSMSSSIAPVKGRKKQEMKSEKMNDRVWNITTVLAPHVQHRGTIYYSHSKLFLLQYQSSCSTGGILTSYTFTHPSGSKTKTTPCCFHFQSSNTADGTFYFSFHGALRFISRINCSNLELNLNLKQTISIPDDFLRDSRLKITQLSSRLTADILCYVPLYDIIIISDCSSLDIGQHSETQGTYAGASHLDIGPSSA